MIRPAWHSKWAYYALHAGSAAMAAAPVGARNDTLNRTAFIIKMVASGSLDAEVVEFELMAAAASAGLGTGEARATIASELGAGIRQRRVCQTAPSAEARHDGASW